MDWLSAVDDMVSLTLHTDRAPHGAGAERDAAVISDSAFAVPYKRAAVIAGISVRQLDYWSRTGLVVPSITEHLSTANHVRLYTLQDMVELVVAARLRRALTLQHIRRTVTFLRGYASVDSPLRELRFAVHHDEIHFQMPDGSWSGEYAPDQTIAPQVLALDPIVARIRRGAQRPAGTEGRIERVRKVRSSKPVFAGTRVPVSAVSAYLKRGIADDRILDAFPDLTVKDIEAARHSAA